MDGDDEAVTKKVVRRSRPAEPKRSRPAAPATPSGPPVYGTPPGTDPALPVYGSRDSAKPVEPARHDFDPRAEEKAAEAEAAAAARRAAAAAREAKAAEVAQAAKARAKKRAAEKAAKKQAARAAYAAKKERTARIAEETRWARFERNGQRGNDSYARARQRKLSRRPPKPRVSGVARPVERARKSATVRNLLVATLLIAGAIFIPIIVTNSSPSSSTVSDGVDWTGYPGQRAGDAQRTLAAPSKEQVVAQNTALLAELRAAVDDEVTVSWLEHGSTIERPLENAWGAPSLLRDSQSPRWYTTEPISGQKLKQRLVERVSEVLSDHGFQDPQLMNDPETTFYPPKSIERLYGGSKLDTQVVWELKASSFEDAYIDVTVTITDFSKDKTGEFAADAEADAERLDLPVSSIAMTLTSHALLSASDAPAFRERAAPFEDKKPPKR